MVARRYARTARSYLQFSFVNNKPWRRRGSDFNEGINNPGCGREARLAEGTPVERDNGKGYGGGVAGERCGMKQNSCGGRVVWQESRENGRSVSRFYDAASPARLGKRETSGISRTASAGFNFAAGNWHRIYAFLRSTRYITRRSALRSL